jgi:hypothetical protein
MTLRLAPAIAAFIALLLLNSCDSITKNVATKGPARYKAEVAAHTGQMLEELAANGVLGEASKKKFDSIIAKWEGEFKQSNSMRNLKEAQTALNAMATDPNNSFQHKENAVYNITEALRNLETEVKSD